MNIKQHNTDNMQAYHHNGTTLFLDDETFYTEDGILIGTICSRGSQFSAFLYDDDGEEITQVNGVGDVDMERDIDVPLDVLLGMFHGRQRG